MNRLEQSQGRSASSRGRPQAERVDFEALLRTELPNSARTTGSILLEQTGFAPANGLTRAFGNLEPAGSDWHCGCRKARHAIQAIYTRTVAVYAGSK